MPIFGSIGLLKPSVAFPNYIGLFTRTTPTSSGTTGNYIGGNTGGVAVTANQGNNDGCADMPDGYTFVLGGTSFASPKYRATLIEYNKSTLVAGSTANRKFEPGAFLSYIGTNDIAIDSTGHIYVVGWTQIVDGITDTLYPIIAKISASGSTVLWQKRIQIYAARNSYGYKVKIDTAGNVIVSGCVYQSVTSTGSGSSAGQITATTAQAFVCKFDGSGNMLWTNLTQIDDTVSTVNIDLDAANNIYMSVSCNPVIGAVGGSGFITKMNSNGVNQWSKIITNGADKTYPRDIFVDSANNVLYVTGSFKETQYGNFVLKMNLSGTSISWTNIIGTTDITNYTYRLHNIELNDSKLYVTQSFKSTSTGGPDGIYVYQLDTDGALIYSRRLWTNGGGYSSLPSLTFNDNNEFIVSGQFSGGVQIAVALPKSGAIPTPNTFGSYSPGVPLTYSGFTNTTLARTLTLTTNTATNTLSSTDYSVAGNWTNSDSVTTTTTTINI